MSSTSSILRGLAAGVLVTTLAGCPKKGVTVYHSLSEPGAMQTCNANKNFRVEAKGSNEADAKANAVAKAREEGAKQGACGVFIMREAVDQKNFVAYTDAQICDCK